MGDLCTSSHINPEPICSLSNQIGVGTPWTENYDWLQLDWERRWIHSNHRMHLLRSLGWPWILPRWGRSKSACELFFRVRIQGFDPNRTGKSMNLLVWAWKGSEALSFQGWRGNQSYEWGWKRANSEAEVWEGEYKFDPRAERAIVEV